MTEALPVGRQARPRNGTGSSHLDEYSARTLRALAPRLLLDASTLTVWALDSRLTSPFLHVPGALDLSLQYLLT